MGPINLPESTRFEFWLVATLLCIGCTAVAGVLIYGATYIYQHLQWIS